MRYFAILLFSAYILMATLAAPLLHFGDEIRLHPSSDMAAMNMESRGTNSSALGMSDIISRCLRAAAFFTTAIPSSPLTLAILTVVLLLYGILARFMTDVHDLMKRWKFAEIGRIDWSTILYLAQRPFRKWLALLELSPNFIAASSG
ncbi:MAG: hypothetical protein Q7S09_01445 [bacterium]|nr:hypothetical protein [bacterium]